MLMFNRLDLILPETAFQGPVQMALDETLLHSVCRPTLRCYRWDSPCVSYGYFQKHAEVRKFRSDLPAVRRWTGGGMVEHGRDFTFSLMIPRGDPAASLSPSVFYRELHGILARWLSTILFPTVRLAEEADLRAGDACFSAPVNADVLLEGRKILGGAQRRSHGALLYQGSLQFPDALALDPMVLGAALNEAPRVTSLDRELLERGGRLARERYMNRDWEQRR
jgi:lipoyl(octanoyl) transferase